MALSFWFPSRNMFQIIIKYVENFINVKVQFTLSIRRDVISVTRLELLNTNKTRDKTIEEDIRTI